MTLPIDISPSGVRAMKICCRVWMPAAFELLEDVAAGAVQRGRAGRPRPEGDLVAQVFPRAALSKARHVVPGEALLRRFSHGVASERDR